MMKQLKRMPIWIIPLLIFSLSSFSVAYASVETTTETVGDLTLRRTVPESVYVGQEVWIVLEIENNGGQDLTLSLVEKLGEAEFDKTQAKSIQVSDPGHGGIPPSESQVGLSLWYYEWKIELPAGESATLAYWILPTMPGTYVISPAEINIGSEVFQAKSCSIDVMCKANAQCDVSLGENVLTCPEDCFTGTGDGFCDGASDGRVDPDCEEGYDPDAVAILPTATASSTEPPTADATPYLVIIGALLAIVVIVAIVGVLIVRERRRA
jgi:hypothetical protein